MRIKKVKDRYEIELGKPYGTYRTVWIDAKYDANEYGKKIINSLIPDCPFDFPKSLWNVYDCLYAVISENKKANILDFFAGSGTTGHAVMELNAEDVKNCDVVYEAIFDASTDINELKTAYENAGFVVVSAENAMIPSTYVSLTEEQYEKFQKMIDVLEDLDDVDEVYHNVE